MDKKAKEAAKEVAIGVSTTIAAAGMDSVIPGSGLVSKHVFNALAKVFSDQVSSFLAKNGERAFFQLFQHLRMEAGEDAEAKLQELLESEEANAVTTKYFLSFLDADRSVAPALALLTADYVNASKPSDAFFRETVELFLRLDRTRASALKVIVDFVHEVNEDIDKTVNIHEFEYRDEGHPEKLGLRHGRLTAPGTPCDQMRETMRLIVSLGWVLNRQPRDAAFMLNEKDERMFKLRTYTNVFNLSP